MSEATRPLRLVPPPPEAEGRTTRAFGCRGLDALKGALEALAAGGGPAFRLVGVDATAETWLDTDDQRILRAGVVLHVEAGGLERIARLTSLRAMGEADAGGRSFAQPLIAGPLEDALRAAGPVGDRVRALAGRRPLDRRLEVVRRRHRFEAGEDSSRIEIRLDDVRDVALLTIAGSELAVDALTARLQEPCELAPAPPIDELPAPPDFGSEAVDPSIAVSALAFVNLRRHARSFLRNEPGTRLGDDPEALHDMRVAGRRMRAALGLFEAFLPRRGIALRRELGRIGRVLGAVRDLDVQLDQLAHWRVEADPSEAPSFDAIESVLVRKRRAARRRMLATLDGSRYERFLVRLGVFLRHGPGRRPAIARRPALEVAPELIGRRHKAVRKAGDRLSKTSTAPEFHALRIRAKRFRYALEFHAALYDGDVAAMIESLTALQDLLGEHQDAYVAIGHLEALAGSGRRGLPPRSLFLMGSIAARYAQRARQLRRAFPKTFRRIRGGSWKALQGALAKGAASRGGAGRLA